MIAHDRPRILHCNVTRHPTGLWITQENARPTAVLNVAPVILLGYGTSNCS